MLLIAFGSLLAMGLPVLTAVLGIGAGLSLIALLGHVFPAPSFSPIVASMIGLGVGVDYALFILTRFREALHRGEDPETATRTPETLINAQFQDRAASNRRIRSVWSAAENRSTGP